MMGLSNKSKGAFRPTLLSAAIAASMTASVGVSAQEVQEALEEVTVTGIRTSVLDSIEAKRSSDVVAEVVDAGDLGSLPDVSIADALGRLPGVTTVRESGQSSQLNIRGMNGDFVQTSLNGREQASTSGYTAGSRWIAFDQYPSELITQAAVYKSPKASLIEGGVAGTVEMKTANPLLAEKEHNFNANVRYSLNDSAENVGADEGGHRVSFSYQGKFLNDTLGVAIGYADLSQPNSAEHVSYLGVEGERDVNGDGADERIVKGFQARAESGNDERKGYLASVVWEPNDSISTQFDYFRSDFSSEDLRSGYYVEGLQRNADTFSFTNPIVEDGFVTGGTVELTGISGPWIEMRTEDQSTESLTESFGFKFDWRVTDRLSAKMDLAHSEGTKTRLDRIASMHAYQFGTDTIEDGSVVETWRELEGQTVTFKNNASGVPDVAFNTDYTDLSHMRLGDWEQFPHLYTDELDSAKFDFKFELDNKFFSSVEAGVRWSDRVFSDERSTFRWGRREGQSALVQDVVVDENTGATERMLVQEPCQSGTPCQPFELDGFVSVDSYGGSLSGFPDYMILDLTGIANAVFGSGNYDAKQTWDYSWTLIESGKVKEEVLAYYLMGNIDTEFADISVTGNLGVRIVETDTKSVGIQQVGDIDGDGVGDGDEIIDDYGVAQYNYAYIAYGPEYTDVLPSLNLNFHITEQDQIRFAAAKVMGRPPVYQLRGGAGSWVDTANDGVSPRYNVWAKGNPNLDPFRAKQVDVSYEHYFENGGAATVAVFYKDIESLIENITYSEGDIAWSEIGLEAPEGFVEGQYETTRNNDMGGYIRGLEMAYTTTFDQLPGIFSGLGATASYSYTESETAVDGGSNFPDVTLPLPGLSENVWSSTIFWDIGNFSTNVNVRYRDEYVFAGATPGGSTLTMAEEYTVVDMQASYAFDNGIDILFQANNLTNEPNVANYGSSSAVAEYAEYGRQYYMGVSYKF